MIVKIHQKDDKTLITVCDKELIGKVIEEGDVKLDLASIFYQGEEKTEEETGDLLRNADYIHLVGKKAIAIGLNEGIIERDKIIYITGIPYAQAVIEQKE